MTQLIEIQNDTWSITNEGAKLLASLKAPICVAAIIGKIDSGKSTLFNLILESDIFKSRPSKGIQLYVSQQQDRNLIFLDCEGISSPQRHKNFDAKLFSLIVLLSSQLVYNQFGVIEENSLNTLSLAAELSKHLRIKKDHSEEEEQSLLSSWTPHFIWVLRDFILDQKDKYQNQMTADQYLEDELHKRTKKNQAVRNAITNYFKTRMCFTLVRPVLDENLLESLNVTSNLRSEFLEQLQNFKIQILNKTPVKMLNGKAISGEVLLDLLRVYIDAINSYQIPFLHDSLHNIAVKQYEKINELNIQQCKEFKQSLKFPYRDIFNELIVPLLEIREPMLQQYKMLNLKDGDMEQSYLQKTKEWFQNELLEITQENKNYEIKQANEVLEINFATLKENIQLNKYEHVQQFQLDWEAFLKECQQTLPGQHASILARFLKQHSYLEQLYAKFKQDKEKYYQDKKGEQAYMTEKIQDHEANLKEKQQREIDLTSDIIDKQSQIKVKENARIAEREEILKIQDELKKERQQVRELQEKYEDALEKKDKIDKSCKCLIM